MYTIDWIVEKRIIQLRNEGELTGDEIKALSKQLGQMLDEGVAPVHIIEDDRDIRGIADLSLDTFRQSFQALDTSKLGWAIAIMPEELEEVTDILGRIFDMFTDVDYQQVETVPEALDFLAEHDATLPDRSEWQLAFS
jgi:hypothetical protein